MKFEWMPTNVLIALWLHRLFVGLHSRQVTRPPPCLPTATLALLCRAVTPSPALAANLEDSSDWNVVKSFEEVASHVLRGRKCKIGLVNGEFVPLCSK